MMKHFKYIMMLAVLASGLVCWAEEPTPGEKPAIIERDPDIVQRYPNQLPYLWRGSEYSTSGTYYDTIRVKDVTKPDTALTLVLMVKKYISLPKQTVNLYPTQTSYTWRAKEWPVQETTYYDTVPAFDFADPDTIHTLVMHVKRYLNMFPTDTTVCQTTTPSVSWRGKTYHETGVYHDTVKSKVFTEPDTTYTLNMTMGVPFKQMLSFQLCPGEQITYRGRTYTQQCADTIHIPSFTGCDSTYIVRVKMGATSIQTEEAHICKGDTFIWHKESTGLDTALYKEGYYFDSLKNTDGCDSVRCLHLKVTEVAYYKDTLALCEEFLPYRFGEQYLNETGVYYDTIQRGVELCDSIVRLAFTVLRDTYDSTLIQFCSGSSVRHNGGELFSEPRVYFDTTYNARGCYHIMKTVYTPAPTYYVRETKHRTQDQINYEWHGQVFKTDGEHQIHKLSQDGCDSTWTLFLITDYAFRRDSLFCEGEVVDYQGRLIDKETIIEERHQTVYGGDSIIELHFKMQPKYHVTEYINMCTNKPIPWPGHEDIMLVGEGVYYDTYESVMGCDSTYEMIVTAFDPVIEDTFVNISRYHADSLPFIWYDGHNRRYDLNDNIDVFDTIGHIYDCDCEVIKSIHFRVVDHWSFDTLHLCPNGEVVVHGHRYTVPGDYEIWMPRSPQSTYQDSISYIHVDTFKITINPIWDDTVICASQTPFAWHNRKVKETGEYKDTIPDMHGCDSIVYLRITVNPTYLVPLNYYVCQGDLYRYKGKDYPAGTVLYDTLHTRLGCDSVLQVIINQLPTYYQEEGPVYFDAGTSYNWQYHWGNVNNYLTKEGVYYDSCFTKNYLCDSIFKLDLREKRTYHFYDDTTICSNQLPFVWKGHKKDIYTAGVYFDSLSTKQGVDSIYELTLIINDVKFSRFTLNKCAGDTIVLGGRRIYASGVYYDSLYTMYGCDSIVEWKVNFHPKFFETEVAHMRNNPTYSWHGMELTEPGYYYDSHTSIGGCDSTYKLILIGDPTYTSYDTAVTCSNHPYEWHGQLYIHSGDYIHKELSQYDRDSIEYLHLVVNAVTRDTVRKNLCIGDVFYVNKRPITQPGSYNDTLRTPEGCDAITTYILNFHPAYHVEEKVTQLNPYEWHGRIITEPGVYYDSLKTAGGCDSVHSLIFQHTDTFSHTEYVTICENELPYIWEGHEKIGPIYYSGKYSDINQSVRQHADSSYYLYLTVAKKYEHTSFATICPGGTLHFFEQTIKEPGTYRDTLLTTLGCDSIFILHVSQAEQKISHDTIRRCFGQYVYIRDTMFTTSGEYEYSTKTDEGCDSILHYVVQIEPEHFYPEYKSINPGDRYNWVGHTGFSNLTTAGVYWDSLITVNGCDSVYRLTLSIRPTYYFEYDTAICKKGDSYPYVWRGRSYYETGTFYDSLSTKQYGLDSVYCLKLTVFESEITYETYEGCEGDVIVLGSTGREFTQNATYDDTIYTYGCPQIIRYSVNFYPRYNITNKTTLIPGQPIYFFDQVITAPGTYGHIGKTKHQCDSIVTLIVTVCDRAISPTILNYTICTGDSLRLGDTIITTRGQYDRTYPSRFGCDSTVHYIINESTPFHKTEYATMCSNESFIWRGHYNDIPLTKPGTYHDRYPASTGCDSTYTLKLTANPTYLNDTTIYRCYDERPYYYKGKEYWTDQDFFDTLYSVSGCDSVSITRYRFNSRCSNYDTYATCEGNELVVDGRVITHEGEHHFPIGTDSVHRFYAIFHPTYDYPVALASACDSIVYRGNTYYARGEGKETFTVDRMLQTVHGCDSIEHVTMTIYQSAPTAIYPMEIYDYSSIILGGRVYNTPGVFEQHYHTSHGCDSVIILNLKVIPTDSTGALHYHFCASSPGGVEVFGKLYHPYKDTIIFDTAHISNTGMQLVRKAIVRVTYPFTITSVSAASEVCSQSVINMDINYTLDGSFPYRYELEFLPNELVISPTKQAGEINNKSTIAVEISGRGLCVGPGVYPYTLKLYAEDCHMSDTIIQSSITVHYPSSIMEANWSNTIALLNKEHNEGRWQFMPPYNWQIRNASGQDKTANIKPNQNLSYLYSNLLDAGDIVTVTPLREGYSKAVSSCEYVFYPVATDNRIPILVYPTVVRKTAYITIDASAEGNYSLYTSTGQKIASGTFKDGKQTIKMPGIEGCYILNMQPKNAGKQVKQIIVY